MKFHLLEGEARTIEALLAPEDPTDPDALRQLAEAFDIRSETWEAMELQRGGADDDWIAILLPRGDVRVEDLGEFQLQIGGAFEQSGAIVFTKESTELFRKEVDEGWPEQLETTEALPQEVLDELRLGAKITWGFHPVDGKPVTATFHVVARDLGKRLAGIDERLAGQDPLVARQLKAQLYLSKGLATAAYREARAIVDETSDAVDAYAVMRGALQKMGLKDSPLWLDLARRTVDLPAKRAKRGERRPH